MIGGRAGDGTINGLGKLDEAPTPASSRVGPEPGIAPRQSDLANDPGRAAGGGAAPGEAQLTRCGACEGPRRGLDLVAVGWRHR